jgi:seryl-tRNA synthetase
LQEDLKGLREQCAQARGELDSRRKQSKLELEQAQNQAASLETKLASAIAQLESGKAEALQAQADELGKQLADMQEQHKQSMLDIEAQQSVALQQQQDKAAAQLEDERANHAKVCAGGADLMILCMMTGRRPCRKLQCALDMKPSERVSRLTAWFKGAHACSQAWDRSSQLCRS